ncbi:hypothetical protein MML48_9g00009091 [Holotrichia oblita]|uniref:Uncharacterized protein n=1 Tax=Holotrichia oblita TaxID=644536 RepID=A0ACB9SKI6_HOLOL|nr:hypothetical protein MML48_9g00009091 [Holotrichia oblita]
MLKVRKNSSTRLFASNVNKFLWQFPDLKYNGIQVVCTVCDKTLLCWNTQMCKKHVNTAAHKFKKTGEKPYVTFICDLIFMFSASNVPFVKIRQVHFRRFWKKYNSKLKLPSLTTLQRHLPAVREKIENDIKSSIKNKRIWLTIDVNTDSKNKSVLSILVRTLDSQGPSQPYLLAVKRLQQCTGEVIINLIVRTLQKFKIVPKQVLMIVTDSTPVMLYTGYLFKSIRPHLLHITCLLHALYLVTDEIRKCYPNVDEFITQTKAFLKSPKHIQQFFSQYPDIAELPQPNILRWGSWLEIAFYYFEHFEKIKLLILQPDTKVEIAIKQSQKPFLYSQLAADLRYIYNYLPIADAIKKLQNTSLSLPQSLEIINNVQIVLQTLNDEKSVRIREEFNTVLSENLDFIRLQQIYSNGGSRDPFDKFKDHFNYANITSLDVERSLSLYKQIFSPQRTRLKETTVETYAMLQVFSRAHPNCL